MSACSTLLTEQGESNSENWLYVLTTPIWSQYKFNDIATELISNDTDERFMMDTVFLFPVSGLPRN
jgi:hypothetical protein